MEKQHSKHNACARNSINDYPMEPPYQEIKKLRRVANMKRKGRVGKGKRERIGKIRIRKEKKGGEGAREDMGGRRGEEKKPGILQGEKGKSGKRIEASSRQ